MFDMNDVRYRMNEEGFHYCFESYSDWKEIEDEEFHRLRMDYLRAAKELEDYVNENSNKDDDE